MAYYSRALRLIVKRRFPSVQSSRPKMRTLVENRQTCLLPEIALPTGTTNESKNGETNQAGVFSSTMNRCITTIQSHSFLHDH